MRVKKELDRLYYRMLSFFDIDGCYNQKNEEESWWDRLWGIERKVKKGLEGVFEILHYLKSSFED